MLVFASGLKRASVSTPTDKTDKRGRNESAGINRFGVGNERVPVTVQFRDQASGEIAISQEVKFLVIGQPFLLGEWRCNSVFILGTKTAAVIRTTVRILAVPRLGCWFKSPTRAKAADSTFTANSTQSENGIPSWLLRSFALRRLCNKPGLNFASNDRTSSQQTSRNRKILKLSRLPTRKPLANEAR